MANRNRLHCYACDALNNVRQMARIDTEEHIVKRDIAIARREAAGRPALEVNVDTRLCINCLRSINNEIRAIENDASCIRLNVLTQTSNATCMFCNAVDGINVLSNDCRVQVYLARDIYIPERVRCCGIHLDERGNILQCLLPAIRFINRPYIFNGHQLTIFLSHLRTAANKCAEWKFRDENSFSDEEFKAISPITKPQFRDMFNFCDPIREGEGQRHVSKKDLLTFLCKLRQGLSDEFLTVVFNHSSRQNTSLTIAKVRKSLMLRFVPQNIGFQAITREQFIQNHVSDFANELYNREPELRKAIVCIDGTYSYIPKSSNFRVLRQSYCVHKGRHLLKPVLVVGTDGYILDVHGPYFSDSRNNDANILRNEFQQDAAEIRNWFQEGDIFIVDRGYRDAIPLLEQLGITYKMPSLLGRNERQLATEEANESRMVSKCRWVVESRNGHLKSMFKFFDGTIQITHAVHLKDFYRIAGAVINRFHGAIEMEGATVELARSILAKAQNANVVHARVEVEQLQRRNGRWVHLDANHLPRFPRLTLDYLRELTVGVYQVNLAPSYIQDKLQRENHEVLEMDELVDEPGFLRLRIFSRFRNAGKYQLWIAYHVNEGNANQAAIVEDEDPILGYYCTCRSGARTLGTCAHIASALWFLGFARHEHIVKYPWTTLIDTILDAGNRQPPVHPNAGAIILDN